MNKTAFIYYKITVTVTVITFINCVTRKMFNDES